MREAEMNTSDVNRTTNFNLERRSATATRAARGIRQGVMVGAARLRSLAVLCVALSLAVVVGVPAGASPSDASTPWSIVPSPNEEGANWLVAVDASAGNNAWAVGYYIGDEGVYETLSAHWNGSAWTLVEPLNVGRTGDWLYGVATVSPSEAWAVGTTAGPVDTYTSTTLIERWTGSAWSVVRSPNPSDDPIYGANQLYDVRAFTRNDVWAVGWQWTPIGSAPLVVRWDGRRWKVSPTPDDEYRQLVALDGTSSSDIWAVGHSFNFNDGYQALAMHWNGRTWVVVPTPILADDVYLNDVSVVSRTDVWAVGYSLPANLDIQPLFLHWDGSAWSVVPSPHLSSTYNYLQSIAAVSANSVWAAGYRTVDGHQVVSFVERWDGGQWRIESTPNRPNGGNYLFDVTVDPAGGLWSAGYFYPQDSSDFQTLIQHRSP
jgi:hypothetical protein